LANPVVDISPINDLLGLEGGSMSIGYPITATRGEWWFKNISLIK